MGVPRQRDALGTVVRETGMRLIGASGDRVRVIETASELEEWSAEVGSEATYSLDVGGREYPIPHLVGPAEPDDVLACAVDAPLPDPSGQPYPWSLGGEYLKGGCDVFACALEELLEDAALFAVHEPDDQDSTRQHMLIHVGFLVEDERILDVEGLHDLDDWLSSWGGRAETDEWTYGYVKRSDLERMQGVNPGERLTEAAIAAALPHASFVARLTGCLPEAPAPRP